MVVRRLLVLALLSAAAIYSESEACCGEFSFRAGMAYSTPVYANWSPGVTEATATGRLMPGGALALEGKFLGALRLQFGLNYFIRAFDIESKSASGTTISNNSARLIQLPLLFRLPLLRSFSVGAGVFYGRYVSGQTSGMTSFDYGPVVNAEWRLWTMGISRILLDARYSMSAMDNSEVADQSLKFRDLQIFLGIAFPMGASVVSQK